MNTSINGISQSFVSLSPTSSTLQSPGKAQANFATILKDSIENVNNVQIASDLKTEALAMGKIDDLHDVMIAAQKASITLETTIQIQRKVIDAYNEVMRMQV